MLLEKFFKSVALCTLFLIFLPKAEATVFKRKCGEYNYIVESYNRVDIFAAKYKLYFQHNGGRKRLFFQADQGGILSAACIKNKKNQDLMLFQEISGGSAGPEDRYGVFDPRANKILVKPLDWDKGNSAEVEALIGYPPPFPMDEDKDRIFFCCSNSLYEDED
ncbi:MAG: hypothetical protein LEGION0403_FIIPPAGN_02784 [Legionella sp.]